MAMTASSQAMFERSAWAEGGLKGKTEGRAVGVGFENGVKLVGEREAVCDLKPCTSLLKPHSDVLV